MVESKVEPEKVDDAKQALVLDGEPATLLQTMRYADKYDWAGTILGKSPDTPSLPSLPTPAVLDHMYILDSGSCVRAEPLRQAVYVRWLLVSRNR